MRKSDVSSIKVGVGLTSSPNTLTGYSRSCAVDGIPEPKLHQRFLAASTGMFQCNSGSISTRTFVEHQKISRALFEVTLYI